MSWNPRYVLYAKAQGRTPEAQMEHDDEAWPGGIMTGYILWIRAMKQEFFKRYPHFCFDVDRITDIKAWDRFLREPTTSALKCRSCGQTISQEV